MQRSADALTHVYLLALLQVEADEVGRGHVAAVPDRGVIRLELRLLDRRPREVVEERFRAERAELLAAVEHAQRNALRPFDGPRLADDAKHTRRDLALELPRDPPEIDRLAGDAVVRHVLSDRAVLANGLRPVLSVV